MLFMVFVFAVGFCLVVLTLIRMFHGHGGNDDEPGDDGPPWWRRRRGPRRPKGPRPHNPEPAWWPEFERQFRVYAATQGARRKVSGIGS
jgi:hypothetical protein